MAATVFSKHNWTLSTGTHLTVQAEGESRLIYNIDASPSSRLASSYLAGSSY